MTHPLRALRSASTAALVFGLLALAACIGLFATSLTASHQQSLADARLFADQLAALLEEHASRTFRSSVQTLAGTAELIAGLDPSADAATAGLLLRRQLTGAPHLRELVLLDAQGRVRADSAERPPPAGTLADREYYVQARIGIGSGPTLVYPGRYLGDDADPAAAAGGLRHFAMMHRLGGDAGFAGVLVAVLNPDYFHRFYQPVDGGAALAIGLWRFDGSPLVVDVPDGVDAGCGAPPGPWLLANVRAGRSSGSFERAGSANGESLAISYRATGVWPVLVTVCQSRSAALVHWYEHVREYGALAATTVLTLGTLGFLLWRQAHRRERLRQRLQQALDFQRALLDAIPSPVFFRDTDGHYLGCNRAFETALGIEAAALRGRTLAELVAPALAEHLDDADRPLLHAAAGTREYEAALPYADGREHRVLFSNAVFRDADGTIAGIVGVITDLTEHIEREAQLALLSQAVEQSPASVVITDPQGRIEYVNRKFEQVTGYARTELTGQNPRLLKSGYTSDEQYRELWRTIAAGGEWHGEFHNVRKNGEKYWEFASISAIRSPDGGIRHFLGIKEDISLRKRFEEQLRHQATHDALTGLPNRSLLLDRLEHELLRAQRTGLTVALLFVDLDRFKAINDDYGHDAGDAVLREVAARLRRAVRSCDTVGRFGGDEFVVVLADLHAAGHAERTARRILAALEAPIAAVERLHTCSASIGITLGPDDGVTATDLLRNGDAAMYRVKTTGRAGYGFFMTRPSAGTSAAGADTAADDG